MVRFRLENGKDWLAVIAFNDLAPNASTWRPVTP